MKKGKRLIRKELIEDYKQQPFEWKTETYGRAEFILCPVVRKHRIREVHLYPAQQPNAKYHYVVKNPRGWEGIHFGSLLIEGQKKNEIHQPVIWTTHFCEKHKSHSFSLYVPTYSKSFFVTTGLGKFCLNWR